MSLENDPETPDSDDSMKSLRTRLEARLDGWQKSPVDEGERPDQTASVFVSWMLESARLAALGEDAIFRAWPRVASHLGIDVQKAIGNAASIGIQRIESVEGRDLAEQIGVAEDAGCLAMMESRTTNLLGSTLAGRWLGAWTDAASHVPLDEDGIQVIHQRRHRWPLPEEMRLPVVQTPLGEVDLLVGGSAPRPPRRLVPQFTHVEEAALFDDGRPTPGMIRRFATRRGAGSTMTGRWLRADAELDPYWQVTLGLQAPGVSVRSVRIGPMAMELHPDAAAPGDDAEGSMLWTASLKDLPLDVRTRVVCGDISIRTDEGDRFLL